MSELSSALATLGVDLRERELLAPYSSFKIGGAADIIAFPDSEEKLVSAIKTAKDFGVPYTVVGNTSNVLFLDGGYRGMIVMTKKMSDISFVGDGCVRCGCGAMLPVVSRRAADMGLSGLEFACGIPGTVGGSVFMNAGAHGGQISDILVSSRAYDAEADKVIDICAGEHRFDYRHSVYMDKESLICLGAELSLAADTESAIRARMKEYTDKRKSTQPLAMPSAGSFFKRPEGYIGAKLIDECGLKGYKIGGAAVSELHAGFIVNLGGASANDVLALAEYVSDRVFERYGVRLTREVRAIGRHTAEGENVIF